MKSVQAVYLYRKFNKNKVGQVIDFVLHLKVLLTFRYFYCMCTHKMNIEVPIPRVVRNRHNRCLLQ